jgi:hypothetical protein
VGKKTTPWVVFLWLEFSNRSTDQLQATALFVLIAFINLKMSYHPFKGSYLFSNLLSEKSHRPTFPHFLLVPGANLATINRMDLWQKYSPYLINLAVLIVAVMVWRAYKKVQGNAADWKTFAQRHAFVHSDNSALGEVSGVVDGVKFLMKQEMEHDYKSGMSDNQNRRYEHDNSSIESMSFEVASAPMSLKLQSISSPRVQLLEKFAKLKGEKIEFLKTNEKKI